MARRSKGAVSINPRSAQNMSTRPAAIAKKKQSISPVKVFGAVGALACIVTSLFIQLPGLDVSGTRMFGIFLAAILLWVTEAVPLAGTAVLVIFLEVLFISDHALLSVGEGAPAYTKFFGALANPVIICSWVASWWLTAPRSTSLTARCRRSSSSPSWASRA